MWIVSKIEREVSPKKNSQTIQGLRFQKFLGPLPAMVFLSPYCGYFSILSLVCQATLVRLQPGLFRSVISEGRNCWVSWAIMFYYFILAAFLIYFYADTGCHCFPCWGRTHLLIQQKLWATHTCSNKFSCLLSICKQRKTIKWLCESYSQETSPAPSIWELFFLL